MFILFPRLPVEIQDLIWEFTLPGPRVMLVHSDPVLPNGKRALTRNPELFHTSARSCDVKIPVALHVTRGSRKLALLYLTERFHGYWNFKLDTLYLDVQRFMGHAARFNLAYLVENGLLAGFKNLALGSEIWSSSLDGNSPHCLKSVRLCTDISTLYFCHRMDNVQQIQEQWAIVPLNQVVEALSPNGMKVTKIFEERLQKYLEDDHVNDKSEGDSRASKLHIECMLVCQKLSEKTVPTAGGQSIIPANS
ncbi:DUF890 domain protein [Rutstroemia sp. NJR-2017a WRK4]|nr:DUF890 domain protein [Rutstroemia sp. NJR-2017a WRK4]